MNLNKKNTAPDVLYVACPLPNLGREFFMLSKKFSKQAVQNAIFCRIK